MATHLLLCLCRRNTEQGIHRLGVTPFCPGVLSREFCVLPLGPNPQSCLSISQVAHLDSHGAPLLHCCGFSEVGWWWGQTASTQPPPDTPRQQLLSKDNILSCSFHGFIYTIHTNTYLPSSQVSRGDTFLKSCSTVSGMSWDVSGPRAQKLFFRSCK